MKNFSKCINGKKINVSTKELGLTEEQIFKLRIGGIDKIDLILVAGDQRIVEILDIDLDIGRDIKISVGKNDLALNIPIDESDDCDNYQDDFNDNYDLEG
jgi:hypothetical protein